MSYVDRNPLSKNPSHELLGLSAFEVTRTLLFIGWFTSNVEKALPCSLEVAP
jgi:hypothetical protein